jgi:hypothetical protein
MKGLSYFLDFLYTLAWETNKLRAPKICLSVCLCVCVSFLPWDKEHARSGSLPRNNGKTWLRLKQWELRSVLRLWDTMTPYHISETTKTFLGQNIAQQWLLQSNNDIYGVAREAPLEFRCTPESTSLQTSYFFECSITLFLFLFFVLFISFFPSVLTFLSLFGLTAPFPSRWTTREPLDVSQVVHRSVLCVPHSSAVN